MSEITQGLIDLNGTLPIQIINFLILVALLRAVAYTLNEYKAQLAAARTKAQEIVDMAEKRAGEEREASIQATKREIEQMKKSAEEQMERERAHAVEQLKAEVVALSLAAAGKIIQKNLDEKDNDAIIGEFIAKLDAKKVGDASC